MNTYNLPAELEAKIPTPPVVCPDCLHNPARLLFLKHAPTVIAAYCEHSFTGAVVDLSASRPMWIAWAPVSAEAWQGMLVDAVRMATSSAS
jgi:hypothetical protein